MKKKQKNKNPSIMNKRFFKILILRFTQLRKYNQSKNFLKTLKFNIDFKLIQ